MTICGRHYWRTAMAVTFDPETLTVVAARGLGFSPSIPINAGMQGVTETQAEAVLAELRPWLRERPPFYQFWKQLEMTVARTRAIRYATIYLRAARAFSQAGRPALQAKLYFFSNPPAWCVLSVANPPEGFCRSSHSQNNKDHGKGQRRAPGTRALFATLQKSRKKSASK
jgi:hypothetical protein